jgi:NifU-like protein involved in Fe-S cluster formation
LPGSTGAQKLLVTRVLEHLDRTAKDSRGDRQTQLGLVDAYNDIELSRRKVPSMLLTLAQAYRAAGQIEKSRATAKEGLALLPGSVKPRLRKLLEIQAQTGL